MNATIVAISKIEKFTPINIRLFGNKIFPLHKFNLGLNVSSNHKENSHLRFDIAIEYRSIPLKPNIRNHYRPSKFAYDL